MWGKLQFRQKQDKRVFIFIDNPADCLPVVRELLEFAHKRNLPLTLITAERVNEWNVRCESLEEYLSDHYKLHYLTHSEIESLVVLL
jgi:hypothetical protein